MKTKWIAITLSGMLALSGCSILGGSADNSKHKSEQDSVPVPNEVILDEPYLINQNHSYQLPLCTNTLDKCKMRVEYFDGPSPELKSAFGHPQSALDLKYGAGKIKAVYTWVPYENGYITGDVIQKIIDYNDNPVKLIIASFKYSVLDGDYKVFSYVKSANGQYLLKLDDYQTWLKGINLYTVFKLKNYMNPQDYDFIKQPFPPLCTLDEDAVKGCMFHVDRDFTSDIHFIPGNTNVLSFYKNGHKNLEFAITQLPIIDGVEKKYARVAPWLGLDEYVGRICLFHRDSKHNTESAPYIWAWDFNSDGSLRNVFTKHKIIRISSREY